MYLNHKVKRMEKTVLLIFFFITATFHSCEKKEDPIKPKGKLYVSNELKSYYFFPKGSWWIYQRIDTTAQIFDTATVVHSSNEMKFTPYLYPYEYEDAMVRIKHTYYPSIGANHADPFLNVVISSVGHDRVTMTSSGKLFNMLPDFFTVPIDSFSMNQKSSGFTTLISFSTIVIKGKQYNDVAHFLHGYSDFKYEIWLAKNIGLVKYFNVEDSTYWELDNYEIK